MEYSSKSKSIPVALAYAPHIPQTGEFDENEGKEMEDKEEGKVEQSDEDIEILYPRVHTDFNDMVKITEIIDKATVNGDRNKEVMKDAPAKDCGFMMPIPRDNSNSLLISSSSDGRFGHTTRRRGLQDTPTKHEVIHKIVIENMEVLIGQKRKMDEIIRTDARVAQKRKMDEIIRTDARVAQLEKAVQYARKLGRSQEEIEEIETELYLILRTGKLND